MSTVLSKIQKAKDKRLKTLNINTNQLSELPKEIGNLTNLRKLYISNNKLSELPKEIGNLTNLRYLSISNNQLSELPKEIGNLTNLRELDISNNQLNEFIPNIKYNICINEKYKSKYISKMKKCNRTFNIKKIE